MVVLTAISCSSSPDKTHEHEFDTAWTTDDKYHWHACKVEGCKEVKDKSAHIEAWMYDEAASTGTSAKLNKVCPVCEKPLASQTLTEGFKVVSDAAGLKAAVLEDNCKIILNANIELEDYLELSKDVVLYGNGKKLTIKCNQADYGASGLYIKAPKKVEIRDLVVNAGSNYSAQTALIYVHGCEADVEIMNVTLNCAPSNTITSPPIGIQNTYDAKGKFTVKNCLISNAKYGMYFNSISNSVIEENTIVGTFYTGIAIAGDSDSYPCKNVTIKNNVLKDVASKNFEAIQYNCGIWIGKHTENVVESNNDITLAETCANGKKVYIEGK